MHLLYQILCFCLLILHIQSKLLVVGDVTSTSARILYEAYDEQPTSLEVSIVVKNDVIRKIPIHLHQTPKILKLDSLTPNTFYTVMFGENDNVTFTTFDEHSNFKILVVSCNRYYDDLDDGFWKRLQQEDRFGIVHIGDQVYADQISYAKNVSLLSFEQLLEGFRNVYRKTWGNPTLQNVLRNGANWMLPDDHDIINNLDREFLEDRRDVILAGRQAFYEYQFQLLEDVFDENGNELEMVKKDQIYRFKRLGPVGLVLADTRFHRTFHYEPENPLLGKQQLYDIDQQLKKWKDDPTIQHVLIFTSVPLTFISPTMAKIVYKVEKERYPAHPDLVNDTIKLMNVMKQCAPKIRIISGDVHQFVMSKLCHKDGTCISQMITSGMTNGSATIGEIKLWAFYLLGLHFTSNEVGGWKVHIDHQFLGNNYGVIERIGNQLIWKGVLRESSELTLTQRTLHFIFTNFIIILQFIFALIVVKIARCFI